MSTSPWMDATEFDRYSPLTENITVDVCVIGAGLGGIAAAYLLQKEGKKVCVLEAYELGSGQTGRTTAHVTTALDDRYFHLEALHGTDGIRLAAESHRMAIDLIEKISRQEKIKCDLERVNGYLFLSPGDTQELLNRELDAIQRAGLTDVYPVHSVPSLPFKSGPALCFPRQVQFHPLQFLSGLANAFIANGGTIYDRTRVIEVKGGAKAQVVTENEKIVHCSSVVVATNTPINDLFAIHTKQAPYRSYVIGARIAKGAIPKGMYWDTQDPYHYVRTHSDPNSPDTEILIVGGEDHKTGQSDHPEEAYEKLEHWMRSHFPEAKETVYQWSGQVMEPVDGLAFLGHNPMDRNNVYVITGDSGNGMTHCMIGAMLINDQIQGRQNAWEKLYQPSRKNLRAIKDFVKENANVAAQYRDWFAKGDAEDMDEIQRGEGAIVREGAHLIAAYRDSKGSLSTVSATCPHLGAVVRWNSAEKTWDCPCHGSRFDAQGKVIEGPACSDLKPYLKEDGIRNPLIASAPLPDLNSGA